MIGIAAQRKPNGDLVIISPNEGFEFEIDENKLNINMINLGNFCEIQVENNAPKSFSLKTPTEFDNLVVEADEKAGFVQIFGAVGVLTNKLVHFYRTKEFGDVACKEENPGEIGTKYKLIVSRLPEDERTGMYSKYMWQGVSDGELTKFDRKSQNSVAVLSSDEYEEDCDVSDEEKGDPRVSKMDALPKSIVGFITGQNPKYLKQFYVACNLSYPGADGKAFCSTQKLKVGDWVEVRFTESDFADFFPPTPLVKTKRFESFGLFKKICEPANYSVKLTDHGLEVRIKDFEVPNGHKKGNNIEDRFLGTISDGKMMISGKHSLVDLVIRRRKCFVTKNGSLTTWFVKESKEASISQGEDSEKSSSVESAEPSKPKKEFHYRKTDHELVSKYQNVGRRDHKVGFLETSGNVKKVALTPLRAVVTSVKPNNKERNGNDSAAYLWLLGEYVPSIYYFSSKRSVISPGHFFEGMFCENHGRWECKTYVKSLGRLMDGVVYHGSIELRITVYQYLHRSPPQRLDPETYHILIGKIVDKYGYLPENCKSGVKIGIQLKRLTERDEFCWVVCKKLQSKHIQLLTAFHEAWHKKGVRDAIRIHCPVQFVELRNDLDNPLEGEISHAHRQWRTQNKENTKECQETSGSTKFAWVTVQDGDFIRMVVFPRAEGQKMSEMRRHVTDSKVYKNVKHMEVQKLYRVKMNDSGEIIKIFDCPQYFSAKSNGEIQFKLVCCDQTLLARNVGLVEPISMPKWVGKLMFYSEKPISKKKVLMQASFKLLDDKDLFVDDEIVSSQGVCFMSIGTEEKLSNQDLGSITPENHTGRKENNSRQSDFQTRLEARPKDIIHEKFRAACKTLDNPKVIEAMKQQNVDTDKLNELKSNGL